MDRFVCVHGHFYQPPRENPWLEAIEIQESAYPYHDWNERITAECYAPNTASRIVESDGRIFDIVNNYSKISFNFGPTLLSWMERFTPDVYDAIIAADRNSMNAFSGHGSAIAQMYNHMIMPLANRKDKYTQVEWGIKDFEERFGRFPEGMWLPETAVDIETLGIFAELGIKFTILAPHQAAKVKTIEANEWTNVSAETIDTKKPYLCSLPSGKTINLFFYDSKISHAVAFGGLLNNGERFAEALASAFTNQGSGQLVNIATDGESYGHHHPHGDMALAYCLYHLETNNLAKITNYAEFLDRFPPTQEVQIVENTSWSCAHGVERWSSNCGCNTGKLGWNQSWRTPLREAMDFLRTEMESIFETEASKYLKDPWTARNNYADVVLNRATWKVEEFLAKNSRRELSDEEKKIVLKLLEMQRHAMLMYTSCGWFFDDISGIETVQVMQYAYRAMQLAKEITNIDLEPKFFGILQKASSNVSGLGNGVDVFRKFVTPIAVNLINVGVHHAISSIFNGDHFRPDRLYCYNAEDEVYEIHQSGRLRLAIGRSKISSEITRDQNVISFAVLWFGDHNVLGGAREFVGEGGFQNMKSDIESAFTKADIQQTMKLIDKHFGTHIYSLKNLFKDEQRKIMSNILQALVESAEGYYKRIFEDTYSMMKFVKDTGITPPKALQAAVEVTLGLEIRKILTSEEIDLKSLAALVENVQTHSITIDGEVSLQMSAKIDAELSKLSMSPMNIERLENIEKFVELLLRIPVKLDLWRSQNIIFQLGKLHYDTMREKSQSGDSVALKWVASFEKLSDKLAVRKS